MYKFRYKKLHDNDVDNLIDKIDKFKMINIKILNHLLCSGTLMLRLCSSIWLLIISS